MTRLALRQPKPPRSKAAAPEQVDDDVIDVVVPVHNAFADARRLMRSLEASRNVAPIALRVIDDASTEVGTLDLPAQCERFIEVSFTRNAGKRGFAACVNAGIAASRRDVIILNTDTLVFADWADRLRRATAGERIATATPFSNAATIFSYPFFARDFAGTLEIDWAELDQLCRALQPEPVVVPTGVGFCMFIKRACLDEVGGFDAVAFGSGYGEEGDFCRRAVAGGWKHVAAPNVFVWHRGSASFGARAAGLREEAERRLRVRHPDYAGAVAAFVRSDPLLPCRRQLDLARLRACAAGSLSLHRAKSRQAGRDVVFAPVAAGVAGRLLGARRPHVAGMGPLPNLPTFTRFATSRAIRHFLSAAEMGQVAPGDDALPPRFAARIRAAVSRRARTPS